MDAFIEAQHKLRAVFVVSSNESPPQITGYIVDTLKQSPCYSVVIIHLSYLVHRCYILSDSVEPRYKQ